MCRSELSASFEVKLNKKDIFTEVWCKSASVICLSWVLDMAFYEFMQRAIMKHVWSQFFFVPKQLYTDILVRVFVYLS